MKCFTPFLLLLSLRAMAADAPLPPAPASRLEWAAAVTKEIAAWHTENPAAPALLRVVYFTPSDVEPQTGWRERLTRIMRDVSDFYRSEMKRNGFADKGLPLEMENGVLQLHVVRGAQPAAAYRHESGALTEREMRTALQGKVNFDREFVLAIYGMCRKNEDGSYFFYAPYYGSADLITFPGAAGFLCRGQHFLAGTFVFPEVCGELRSPARLLARLVVRAAVGSGPP